METDKEHPGFIENEKGDLIFLYDRATINYNSLEEQGFAGNGREE